MLGGHQKANSERQRAVGGLLSSGGVSENPQKFFTKKQLVRDCLDGLMVVPDD